MSGPPRAWQRMLSGRRLDLLDPEPGDIAIVDIGHGLARVARWNGQTAGPHVFSVAQHSLLVEAIGAGLEPTCTAGQRLEMLLHDAPEYVIGDIISPFKAAIGDSYKAVERRLLAAIRARFGLADPTVSEAGLVKRADGIAAYFEATRLAGFDQAEARALFGEPGPIPPEAEALLDPWPSDVAQRRFLARFHALTAALSDP
ncbi:HD family hydrolase [Methylobacterium sp. BTF04]|uniref:HD family hydrolase n=1 Tax=Methylobacterium sp. BTF04 TaxID=2708300 RepID=UPI0013CFE096|nr:HD family hydrolase [Methylobacterium sp. BTF04]NEU14913.1 HD family hydrolase [Methylobacterium sp. BTF04]